ncbi:hypothetical protein [Marinobacter sp. BGYM27]|nr:hypothetical protein [Marinobacter sp. BGYM27]MDG5499178.1 hypothetical protein [Marinobacter sp. BGYM27]
MTETHNTRHSNPTLVAFDSHGTPLEWQSLGDPVMGGQSDGKLVSSVNRP